MLTIDVKLNGARIAAAKITNISDLAEISDYEVVTREVAFEEAGLPAGPADFKVHNLPRLRSVWCLIEAVARRAAAIREAERREPTDG